MGLPISRCKPSWCSNLFGFCCTFHTMHKITAKQCKLVLWIYNFERHVNLEMQTYIFHMEMNTPPMKRADLFKGYYSSSEWTEKWSLPNLMLCYLQRMLSIQHHNRGIMIGKPCCIWKLSVPSVNSSRISRWACLFPDADIKAEKQNHFLHGTLICLASAAHLTQFTRKTSWLNIPPVKWQKIWKATTVFLRTSEIRHTVSYDLIPLWI